MTPPFGNDIRSWLFFARQRIRTTGAWKVYRELDRTQRLPLPDILALNWQKRRDLLRYAAARVPFYRKRFRAAGLAERHFDDASVWKDVPLLTRRDVVDHFAELRAEGWPDRDVQVAATGGTTGAPVKVLHDLSFPGAAIRWRLWRWWGLCPDSTQARVGRFTDEDLRSAGKLNKLNQVRMSASCMDDEALDRFAAAWNRVRPELLGGYVGGIHQAALYCQRKGIRMHRPVAIQTTTAPLTAGVRKQIEAVFGAPVYDQYGSCEIYWLAAECRRQRGLHMLSDVRHIEFTGSDGREQPPDEFGQVVVTDLTNRAFPLIRYVNGDGGRALSRPCDCGIHLPLMEAVKGRVTDDIRLADGTVINGVYLSTIFDAWPDAVLGFQVHQKRDYSIDLKVIPNPHYARAEDDIEAVRRALAGKVREQVPVTVVRVETIPTVRGKTRYIVSDVA
jgi:phenylacetate-CoA ligase